MTLATEDAMEKICQAINVGDDMVEDSAYSLTVNPAKSKKSGDVPPSLEDVTWADSCLVNDASDPDWAFMLDALAEALSSHPDAPANTASERDTLTEGIDMTIAPTGKGTDPLVTMETTAFDSASIPANEELEKNSDKNPMDDKIDASPLESKYQNVFLPTYKESTRDVDNFVAEFDSYFPVYAMEPRTENIFQEWDIDIPDEEDELTKQLNKILSGINTSQSDPLNFDDDGVWEVSRGRSIDDLVAGFIDLSIDDLNSGVSDLSSNGHSC